MNKALRIATALFLGALGVQADLLQNGSFEIAGSDAFQAYHWEWNNPDQNASSWGTASREAWRSYSGGYEAAIRGSWAGDTCGGWWQQAPAEAGVTYTASAWFWADASWSAEGQGLKIEFYDSMFGAPLAVATQLVHDVSESWAQKTVQAKAPDNAVWVRVVIYADNVGALGALQFDEVSLIAESGTVIVISSIPAVAGLLLVFHFMGVRFHQRRNAVNA
ncbi:MAG: hypothetical protein EOM20_09650 [Spartobacteria bacterium]|nr:hypothetical protein [Spartobacteria bacterium]